MRAIDWLKRTMPRREALEGNRLLRPFAHLFADPNIWHFNRRSVARGVAVGVFVGVMIPVAQTPFAALAAVPTRSNVAVAALMTFITNPLTTPAILFGAYETGSWLMQVQATGRAIASVADAGFADRALAWLAQASLPTLLGLTLFAVVGALAGYGAIHLLWRIRISRRWAARRARRVAAA